MDSNYRALILVLVVGTLVMGIGATTLFIVFRRFGEAKAGGTSHKSLMAALIVFIFLCCLGLLMLSYSGA
ncbi:MAG TPA: hypothetical protein VGQ76_19960 [Thermoanaerobaculia bacterium]|jgi:hypothetical protein|nr:hypothetical protein [Thermoanaerobaculia bacterium]